MLTFAKLPAKLDHLVDSTGLFVASDSAADTDHADAAWPPLLKAVEFARRHPVIVDVLGVLALDLATMSPLIAGSENRAWVWLLHQALILPLLARRKYPLTVFWVLGALAFAQWLANVPLAADASLLVALYSIAAHQTRIRALVAAGVLEIGVVLASVRFAPADDGLVGSLVFLTGLVTSALLLGVAIRSHRAYLASMVDRTAQLEHERDQQARLATTAERTRIAREMHDIVAHSLSVMIALADGAALTNRVGSDEATGAMVQVSATGRQALGEMRRLLGVLRDDDNNTGLAPQPGLAELDSLAEQVRSTGLPVRLTETGDRQQLPATEETTVYRIVQESLTNTLKHAANPTEVSLTLAWAPDELRIEVTDDGRAVRRRKSGGHGLTGMAERAALFTGSVAAGPLPSGGWQVRARLPITVDVA